MSDKKKKAPISKEKSLVASKLWTFPKNTLEDAIKIAKAIEEKHAGNPMRADELAKAVGYKRSDDWRFLDLLRSANFYGLVDGTGSQATVGLTKIGQDVVSPSSPSQRLQALADAFRAVEDFAKVEKFYGGKPIPDDEYFLNTLNREFGILRERLAQFGLIFRKNLEFLGQFNAPIEHTTSVKRDPRTSFEVAAGPLSEVTNSAELKAPATRQFLDTCFMMMPFGPWFDKYYQDIYSPAIRDAGFEPVRADEIFHAGSFVEQVWEQIEKAEVLLADLTDRNANVFYELGLAHAAGKPVVFTTGKMDDVPSDLRHLRVIVYDIREPDWSSRLRKSITDYLRNAKAEPEKSIPQPFRRKELAEDPT